MNEEVKGPRRRKRLLIAGAIAVTAIPLVALVLFALFRTTELNQRIAELRSQGLPTNAAELNSWYSVPPDVTDTTELWVAATTAVMDAKIDQRAAKIPIVGKGPTPVPAPDSEWEDLEISRTFLNELKSELHLIRCAADAGGMARYPVDFKSGYDVLLPAQQQTRILARLLTLQAHVHAHEGRHVDAIEDINAIFAVSDSLRGEPIVLSKLIRIAIHAVGCSLADDLLPHGKWTDAELEDLQISIGRARFRDEMVTAFHGERVCCLIAIDSAGVLFRDSNQLKAIELFSESTEGLKISWQEATKRHKKTATELAAISTSWLSRMKCMLVSLLIPSMQQAANSGMRAEARQNCAIATLAAYRYQLQHGTLPQSLTDLQSLIPGDAIKRAPRLIDSFDGQQLRFKSTIHSVTIYSIGENFVDDGGDIEDGEQRAVDMGYSVTESRQQASCPE